jgi:glycosyltransferase involved in cell wall biosynthesis
MGVTLCLGNLLSIYPSIVKICLVTETFPPEINGVSMTLNRLVTGLSNLGHQIHVIRPSQFKGDGEKKPDGYTEKLVLGIPIPGYDILKMGVAGFNQLRRQWKEFEPDVIHIATEGPLGMQALFSAHRNKIPVVSSFHTNFHSYGKHYRLGWLTGIGLSGLKYFHNKTRLTLVPSEDLRGDLREEGFKNLKIMGRGVDTELFSPSKRDPALRKTWGVAEDQPVLIYVGRLAGEKNIPLTVKAYEQVVSICPDMKFVLVGDGPERASIEEAHPELIFSGMQRGEDLARYYASGDAFLFPSTTETFGNVVTEAMASGLVVLGYNYAAPGKYIKHGQNGWLAPFDDSEAFLEQSRSIFSDLPAWDEVRKNARITAEGLRWEAILESYISDIEEAILHCE